MRCSKFGRHSVLVLLQFSSPWALLWRQCSTMAITQNELILDATRGFTALLNNDLELANETFTAKPASPFHGLGLGLTEFLKAALGQEDDLLYGALVRVPSPISPLSLILHPQSILVQAETLATAQLAVKRSKDESAPAFEPGLEYKLLVSVSVLCQGLSLSHAHALPYHSHHFAQLSCMSSQSPTSNSSKPSTN